MKDYRRPRPVHACTHPTMPKCRANGKLEALCLLWHSLSTSVPWPLPPQQRHHPYSTSLARHVNINPLLPVLTMANILPVLDRACFYPCVTQDHCAFSTSHPSSSASSALTSLSKTFSAHDKYVKHSTKTPRTSLDL